MTNGEKCHLVDIRRMLERLEGNADLSPDQEPPDGGPSTSNPGDMSGEDTTPSALEHAESIISNMSVEQLAKFAAIERDFDDTDPEPESSTPDYSAGPGPGGVSGEAYLPLGAYSESRADPDDSMGKYLSDADQARLEVITGGGDWVDVTPEDMAAAQRILDEM